MRYVARMGIVFVAVMFANKVTPGINVENQWYEFFLALIFGMSNAFIKPIIELSDVKLSWTLVFVFAVVVNFFLYLLTYWGVFSWLGISMPALGSAIMATAIVSVVSTLVNHYKGFKADIQ